MDFPNNIAPKLNEIPIEKLRALGISSNGKESPCGHKVKVVNDRELNYLTDGCYICFDSFKNKTICKYNCGHIFDEDCTKKWLAEKANCPTCRDKTEYTQNYQTPTEYFNSECIECDDTQCCKNKSQTQPSKIPINTFMELNTDTERERAVTIEIYGRDTAERLFIIRRDPGIATMLDTLIRIVPNRR